MLYVQIWFLCALAWTVFFSIFERPHFNWGVKAALQIFALSLMIWPYLALGYIVTKIGKALLNRGKKS